MEIVFGKKWFENHQRALLWLLNAPVIKAWFRYVLRIHNDCGIGEKIVQITPSSYSVLLKIEDGMMHLRGDFRSHDKFSKRLYYAFKSLWYVMHALDWAMLDRVEILTKLSFGFSTLTVFPNGTTTIDGIVYRDSDNETWATITTSAGQFQVSPLPSGAFAPIYTAASTTTNQFATNTRTIVLFDTSALTAAATVQAAVISLFGQTGTAIGLGTTNLEVIATSPASNSGFAISDYQTCGSTSFGTVAIASWNTAAYNDFTMSAPGVSNVSKTGVSKFGFTTTWDTGGRAFTGTWSSGAHTAVFAQPTATAGTTQDPKLVITYALLAGNFLAFM